MTVPQETNERAFAVLGGGCFWCTEAAYQRIDGVIATTVGYAGGNFRDPSYEQVCSGRTGHAEVVLVEFDPRRISYAEILGIFWKIHDPTTKNRQGADVGTQYRSIILATSDVQKEQAERSIREADASGHFARRIVTQVEPLSEFYMAEEYHQRYFDKNPEAGYCRVVIQPKVRKLEHELADRLR